MEPMQASKRVLIYFSLYPNNDESKKWTRVARCILPLLYVVIISCAILGCLSFIMKFKSTNMEATLFTVMVALVYVGLIFIMAFAFFSRSNLASMFEGLSEIYQASWCSSLTKCHYSNALQFLFISQKLQMLIRRAFWHGQMIRANGCGSFYFAFCHAFSSACL